MSEKTPVPTQGSASGREKRRESDLILAKRCVLTALFFVTTACFRSGALTSGQIVLGIMLVLSVLEPRRNS